MFYSDHCIVLSNSMILVYVNVYDPVAELLTSSRTLFLFFIISYVLDFLAITSSSVSNRTMNFKLWFIDIFDRYIFTNRQELSLGSLY